MPRTVLAALALGWLSLVSSDSAVLISEPQDFDEVGSRAIDQPSCQAAPIQKSASPARLQVFDDTLCWAVLFASLNALQVEEEAKKIFLLVPHYNFTFVQFASTTIEEVPDISEELGVNASNVPRVREWTAARCPASQPSYSRLLNRSTACAVQCCFTARAGMPRTLRSTAARTACGTRWKSTSSGRRAAG